MTPLLALALSHDLLLSKKGIALPAKHGLHVAISRHKARLSAELTKERIRRGFATVDALRTSINNAGANGADPLPVKYPRWIRINTIRTTLDEQLGTTFSDYTRVTDLQSLGSGAKALFIDQHVPNLIGISPQIEITNTPAYKEGKLILQNKASCFPALLLNPTSQDGDLMDACAAPGNKTTHLAALSASTNDMTSSTSASRSIYACEKDATRAQTLSKMVKLAKADGQVRILEKQDFLRLNPKDERFQKVTALLLDPSCSGSGIVGRDEATVTIHLPSASAQTVQQPKGKKRKRGAETISTPSASPVVVDSKDTVETAEQEETIQEADREKLKDRLTALSTFQLRIVEHAMAFPAATSISYSTCSVHDEENEHVVVRALLSKVARDRGWRILKRDQQVVGMRMWSRRGRLEAVEDGCNKYASAVDELSKLEKASVAEGCIRCQKGTDEMTMGFFLAGFVRDDALAGYGPQMDLENGVGGPDHDDAAHDSDEWEGFSDESG